MTSNHENTERLISWIDNKMSELDTNHSSHWADLVLWMKVQHNPTLGYRQTLIELAHVKEFIQAYLCWEPGSEPCPADCDSSHVPPWSSLFITTRPGSYDQEGIDFTASCFRRPLHWGRVLEAINTGLWHHSSVGGLEFCADDDDDKQEQWIEVRQLLRNPQWDFWVEPDPIISLDPQPVA